MNSKATKTKNDMVIIHIYGETQKRKRSNAIKFYSNAMMCCEGSERERYTNIYLDLMAGKAECFDDAEH